MQSTDPSRAKRPGYVGAAMERMHLHRGARTGNKDETPSSLSEKTHILTRTHLSLLTITILIGSFLAVALLSPLATTIDWNGSKARTAYTEHSTIWIVGNDEFLPENGVTAGGDGTASNPYVIENWEINASGFFGIAIMDTSMHYVIRNVHVFAEGSFGIYLANAPNGTVVNSLLDDGAAGIVAGYCDYLNISDNTIANQDMFGIDVAYSEWVSITGNDFADNNLSAIALLNSDNTTMSSNTILRTNITGIMVFDSNYTQIIGNNASDSPGMGLVLEAANDTLIRDNDFTNNAMYGIHMDLSTDMAIYHNRFIGNGVQAYAGNSTNVSWDAGYPDGGNFWSDYTGSDEYSGADQDVPGADGMGDTPYSVDGSGEDRYPWMVEEMTYVPELGAVLIPVVGVMVAVAVGTAKRKNRGSR